MQKAKDIIPVKILQKYADPASTEYVSDRYVGFDVWDSREALEALWQGQVAAISSVRPAIQVLADAADAIANRLGKGTGRLIYTGAGASGLLAMQDGMEMNQTFGWPVERLELLIAGGDEARLSAKGVVEDDAAAADQDAARVDIKSDDVVIGVAASGSTPYTVALTTYAQAAGALTVAIINNRNTALGAAADFEIVLESGPEVIAGSTRLGAGTAQKAALGMLSTLVMTRLGHVFDGHMVNVIADNKKLVERAVRMIVAIADVDDDTARIALETCHGQVKNAVLVAKGMSAVEAESALVKAEGDLRIVLNLSNSEVT
jgi:N-acetylmuramic acid 6-phosphate etherase